MKAVKYIFFLLMVLFFGYMAAGQIFLPADKLDQRNICYEYPGDWYRIEADGTKTLLTIPGRYEKNIGTIETVIPDGLDNRISCLCFRAQDMKAYLDGQLIYEYSTEHSRWFGKNSPECYVTMPVTAEDAGKVLQIELVSDTGLLFQPYVGSELGIWVYLLHMYAGELLVAAVTLIMGLLTILISKVYGWANKKEMDIAYLGCGVTLAAIWLVANSVFRQIILPNISVASDMPFLMVMLIPIPFIIYMNAIQENRYVRLYKIVGLTMTVIDIVCCALYATGIRELVSSFLFVAIGCFICIISVVLTFVLDMRNGKIREYRYVAFGLLGAFAASAIQLVVYFARSGIFRGSYLALGLLVLLTGAALHTVNNVFSIEKDKTAAVMANEAKGKFLANMSHEIRTPINAVLGMDEMILRESRETQIREYALDIQNAGKSLLSLINDILDISKIDSGKLEIIQAEYDVSSMIHDTMNMISHKAKTKKLEVGLQVDEDLPSRLLGDDVRIRQVLINILNNAVKYTNTGGATLSVTGDRTGNKILLHFKVEDTGIGIKEEDLPKLFAEFERIEEQRNRNIEGTGLGMSITVQLLHLMGSHLQVTSTYGKGSCFFFDLEQEIVDDTPIGNLSERIKNQEKEYVYQIAFTAPDADILVVDDNAVNHKVLRNLLKDTRMRIESADSGEECLKKIVAKKYDLIFLDHMMPGLSGIETLHAFPELEGNLNLGTPVVALTANAVTGAREMYLENGFDDFLTKPIIFEKLEKTILKFLPRDKIREGGLQETDQALNEELQVLLEGLPEINLEYAYLHSGTPKELYEVIVDFLKIMDTDADLLEKYTDTIHEEDHLKQYRVKVHSMKTSAAMIGAVHLSGMARMLELAAIQGKEDTIRTVTPLFLDEWRNYKEKLRPVADREASRAEHDGERIFNKEILVEQLELLQAAMDEMDVDRADDIVALLQCLEYPEEYRKLMNGLFAAVSNLDEKEVSALAGEILLL